MYEIQLQLGVHSLRIVSEGDRTEVEYDGAAVEASPGHSGMGLGSFIFEVEEDGARVLYDIAVVHGQAPSCFVGRNGALFFSDAPGFETDPHDNAG